GLDVPALQRHLKICERTGADACLVVYRDTIVQEWYSPRYHEPMYAMSSTKSITALLVGMLLDERRLGSVDDRVCTYIRSWSDGRRIVSQAWIETATHASQQLNPRYGLLWWIDPEAQAIAMHGHLDTDVHIVPDLALVVVRMQTRPFPSVPEGTYEREAVPLYREFVARDAR